MIAVPDCENDSRFHFFRKGCNLIQQNKTLCLLKMNKIISLPKYLNFTTNWLPPLRKLKGKAQPFHIHLIMVTCFLTKNDTSGLRLPAKLIESFILKYNTNLFVYYRIVKKEFVLVSCKLQRNINELNPYFAESSANVKSL
jgi:hypothetical protein